MPVRLIRTPQTVLLLVLMLGLAGCRVNLPATGATAPAAASVATPQHAIPPNPTSIAYSRGHEAVLAWTTPVDANARPLTRSSTGSGWTESGQGPGRRGSVGDAVERRFEGRATAGPWEVIGTWHSTFVAGGNFDVGGSGPNLLMNRLNVSFEKPLDNYARFAVHAAYVNRQYSFGSSNPLIPSTKYPFSSAQSFRLGVNHFQPIHEKWAVFLLSDVSWSATDTADLGDSFSWTVTGAIGHRFSEKFDAGLGLIVGQLFEKDVFIFGGPQFRWRPSDEVLIRLEGSRLEFSWSGLSRWDIGVAGAFVISRFRLEDDAPQNSQIVQDWRLPMWARARYRGIPNLDVELRLGLDAYRVFTIEDANGDNGVSYATKPAPFVGFRFIWHI